MFKIYYIFLKYSIYILARIISVVIFRSLWSLLWFLLKSRRETNTRGVDIIRAIYIQVLMFSKCSLYKFLKNMFCYFRFDVEISLGHIQVAFFIIIYFEQVYLPCTDIDDIKFINTGIGKIRLILYERLPIMKSSY